MHRHYQSPGQRSLSLCSHPIFTWKLTLKFFMPMLGLLKTLKASFVFVEAPIHKSISTATYLFIYLAARPGIYLIQPPTHLPMYCFIDPPILWFHPPTHPSAHPSILHQPIYLSTHPSISPPIWPSICPPICPSAHPSIHPPTHLFIHPPNLCAHPSAHQSFHLSISPPT